MDLAKPIAGRILESKVCVAIQRSCTYSPAVDTVACVSGCSAPLVLQVVAELGSAVVVPHLSESSIVTHLLPAAHGYQPAAILTGSHVTGPCPMGRKRGEMISYNCKAYDYSAAGALWVSMPVLAFMVRRLSL